LKRVAKPDTAPRIARLMIGLLLVATAAPAQMVGEYRVKALFIYNFAKFVEWPPGTFADPRDPFVMCLAGLGPLWAGF
jgi:hypothetical protein